MAAASKRAIRFALAAIFVHCVVAVVHGLAHRILGITLSHAQELFVAVVIVVAPLWAGLFLLLKLRRVGGYLLVVSMAGALVFGAYYHFVKISPDHVAHLPAGGPAGWKIIFQTTAVVLALTELLGCWAGVRVVKHGAE